MDCVPLIAVAIYAVVKPVAEVVGRWMITQGTLNPKTGLLGLSMTGARSLVGDIVSADLAFPVFTFGSLLVAIQVAGGQYTPRIIATTLLRDNIIRSISGLFVFTLLFANRTGSWMGENEVHQLQVFVTALFGFASVVAFLFLIDYAAKFFITCSDSRVVPELLASTHPGDLFTMRNVGNLIPPATAEGVSTGDLSEASAVEYAELRLKVANIVVCGHSECGAMKAVYTRNAKRSGLLRRTFAKAY